MLALGPGANLALEPDILLRALPTQAIYYAFNVATGDHFRLNRTSYWILENIGEGIEWNELKARFLNAFDVLSKQGEADLESIALQFLENQIVRGVNHGEAEDGI